MKTLWLIDGHSLAYRGFFAFIRNPLRNSKGKNTSAVFGFMNSLLKLMDDKKPEYMLISFDAKGPTFRHEQFKEYKATRPKTPEELHSQIPMIKNVVKALGIQTMEVQGIEADDIIGTVANMATQEGWDAVIFSEDKDFLQLESPNVKILNPRTFEFVHAKEKLTVPPERVPDLLALTGDKVDNIPGVPGIGPKTASQLISAFGGVETIIRNAYTIKKEKIRKAIEDGKDQILLSKELTTIRIEHEIEMKLEDLKVAATDDAALLSTLRELELFSLIKRLSPVESKEYMLSNIDDFLGTAKHEVSIVLHDQYLSLANEDGQAFVFKGETGKLSEVIENSEITKITLDSKELFKGFDVQGKVFDLSLATYLLRPGRRDYSLSSLSIEWLGRPLLDIDSEEMVVNSLGERAEVSHALKEVLDKELEEKGLHSLFSDLEVPLARVLAGMEKKGVLIDRKYFEQESKTLHSKLAEIEEEIYRDAGESFNLRSPAQLGHILFDKLGLPHKKRKKTGYSTDQSVLTELAKTHELPGKILSYRELHKLKSTYIDAIPLLADDGSRVHTIWHQTTTSTGRLSSSNPNLQNIPRQETRKGFISPEGWVILSADYSQIELRILASVSSDKGLGDAFREGKDVHARTASLVFGIPESEVTKEERRKAKAVNFGIVYGMGPYGLSQRLKIGVEEANRFIRSYFATYPGVKTWIDTELDFARKNGYVETLMGRKRWSHGINSDNARIREAEERAIINAPIQGSAADMIKVATIRIYEKLKSFDSQLIMQVHDELVLEVPEKEIEEIRELVKREMENALPLNVPIVVDVGVGKNWDEAH